MFFFLFLETFSSPGVRVHFEKRVNYMFVFNFPTLKSYSIKVMLSFWILIYFWQRRR